MSMASTRFGATDPSLPAVLPSMVSTLSRRHALFGAMVLVSTAVPAAAAPSLDAELFDLLAQHPVAVARWLAARKTADAVERIAIATRPARLEALEHRPGDLGGRGFGLADLGEAVGEEEPRRWYGAKAVDWFGRVGPLRMWSDADKAMVPDPIAEARRAEILSAAEAHAAACLASDQRVGLVAADLAVEDAYAALDAIETRLNAIVPRTTAGLGGKAEWAADSEDEGVMEIVLRQVAAFGLAA